MCLVHSTYIFFRFILKNMEHTDLLAEYYDNFNGTSVVLMNEITPKYFHKLQDPKRFLSFTKDRLFIQNTVFYFHKRCTLRELFNQKLRMFQEAGLVDYWIENYTESIRMKTIVKKRPKKLKVENIFGALEIGIAMFMLCCIFFILEILSVRIRYIRFVVDYFTY